MVSVSSRGKLRATFILLSDSLFLMENGGDDRGTQKLNKKHNPNTSPLNSSICYTTPPLQGIIILGSSPRRLPCDDKKRGKETGKYSSENVRTRTTSKKRWLNNNPSWPIRHSFSYPTPLPVLLPKTRQDREIITPSPQPHPIHLQHPTVHSLTLGRERPCTQPQPHYITNTTSNPQHPSSKQPTQETTPFLPSPSPLHSTTALHHTTHSVPSLKWTDPPSVKVTLQAASCGRRRAR